MAEIARVPGLDVTYNDDGTVTTEPNDLLAVEPAAPPLTAEQRIAAAAAALAQLGEIAAPVLSVDVLDVLVDVRTALES